MNFKQESQQELKEKAKSYQKAFKKHKVHPKSLFWASKKAATLRYKELVVDLNLEGKTILDIGCGFGDIIPFLSKKAKDFSYTGVDIVPEFVQVAQDKYPKHQFILRDCINHPLKEKFDIVISSGTLNSNFKDPYRFRKEAIKVFFDHARESLVFNMAGSHPQPKNKQKNKVYYTDSLIILEYCFSLSSKIVFRHHYHRKDFTVTIFK